MLSIANNTRSRTASSHEAPRLLRGLDWALRVSAAVYLLALVAALVLFKAIFIQTLFIDPLFAGYGLLVCGYILSRFLVSLFYRPAKDAGIRPSVAVVMPAFNEEEAIADSVTSIIALDYPKDKLEVVVVNDGSTDGTLREASGPPWPPASAPPAPKSSPSSTPTRRSNRMRCTSSCRASPTPGWAPSPVTPTC